MRFWIISAALWIGAVFLALSGANNYLFFAGFVVLQSIVLASAWNILGGYAGYVNFGVPAFIGAGAYAALTMHLSFGANVLVQIAAASVVTGLIGFLVGLLTVRLRGIFFSIATVALVFIFETLVMNSPFLGGATGMQLTRPESGGFFSSYMRMLVVVMTGLAVLAVATARYVQQSHIGRGLRAARRLRSKKRCPEVVR
ncbi:MAG: branched-chain amino acid ABC transporter permease [Betaproteobacteria bacterium]|nr:branched-chain amino acid ABC transporter permease [Betaproteobacteria bacterium]